MTRTARTILATGLLLLCATAWNAPSAASPASDPVARDPVACDTVALATTQAAHPQLIVLIVIDQFSAAYLTRFGHQLKGGIPRLMRAGATFTQAFQDHAITETAPGHASLLSGRFPRSTGIMMNAIGVDDTDAPLIAGGYGPGASPRRFQGTTLVDWLRSSDRQARSLSVSMKDRGAILPVGRAVTDVFWYSPNGRFVTSSYYGKKLPEWVVKFNAMNVPARYAGRRWDLLLPDSAYSEPDSVDIESGSRANTFPYQLPADMFDAVNLVRGTPFIDDIVATFALHGIRARELGASPSRTDLVNLSLSATDVIGHGFGPDSREIHDQVLRVDRVIGTFLDSLYAMRDSSTVTVVLTSDHGLARIPELEKDVQPPPTRASMAPALTAARRLMQAAGVDSMAIDSDQAIVLLQRAAFTGKRLTPDSVLATFAHVARTLPGVARVDGFLALLADSSSNAIARRWAHQFPSTVNVELIVTLSAGSTWGGNIASHGSPYDYDAHVPLIFSGFGITHGTFDTFVRTVDIAPTLAAIAGVKTEGQLDGVVLTAARRSTTQTP